jgi:hypothetical protein
MNIQKIEKDLAFPMKRKNLREEKDFKVKVKIGGGNKTAEIEFNDWKMMNEFEGDLQTIADREGLKLELVVKKAA